MKDELSDVVPCSSLAVDSILRVGTAGAIWGLCIGPYDARKMGLSGIPRAYFVAKSVGKFSFQCGLVAGVFTVTRCGIQRYRRRDDWVSIIATCFPVLELIFKLKKLRSKWPGRGSCGWGSCCCRDKKPDACTWDGLPSFCLQCCR
ncbi:outer envelope pore protein 16-4, chloroplastic isoform X1 [Syzygium oleosum]|uniref:outer envelope pore protein 16-4, chloroplastic isoform X1 n=1 Tax=Syzygium oleosum TaxID=219896 RepID=UPI0024B90762|nr:outer envelope pore protein 16-4, chloroplastic isoform X1 [Syzygium oleosum]